MNRIKNCIVFLSLILLFAGIKANAQSQGEIDALLKEGRYLQAAKELRPLADNGVAWAQARASWLFFEGKGVQKNEQQGIKYATLGANQGNEDALGCLLTYYEGRGDKAMALSTARKYTDKFPQLLKGQIGWVLGERYVYNDDKENEEYGWKILTDHPRFDETLKSNDFFAQAYWDFQRRKNKCSSLDDLAEKYYTSGFAKKGGDVINYIITSRYSNKQKALSEYKALAEKGNSFAMANYARLIIDNSNDPDRFRIAKSMSEQATQKGSAYGAYLHRTFKDLHFVGESLSEGIVFWVGIDGMVAKLVSHNSFFGKKYDCKRQLDELNKKGGLVWREPTCDEYYQIASALKESKPYYSFDEYMWGHSYPGNFRSVSGVLYVEQSNYVYNKKGRMNCVSYIPHENIRHPRNGESNMSTKRYINTVIVNGGKTYMEIGCINGERACDAAVSMDAYVSCSGRRYKLLYTDIPSSQNAENYWLVFEGIPSTWSQLDLIDSRHLQVKGVK